MRYVIGLTLCASALLLGACTTFQAKKPDTPAEVPGKALSVPVGKHWQVTEEPPVLTNERDDRPAFQKEQSVQPPGPQPGTPSEKPKVETPR